MNLGFSETCSFPFQSAYIVVLDHYAAAETKWDFCSERVNIPSSHLTTLYKSSDTTRRRILFSHLGCCSFSNPCSALLIALSRYHILFRRALFNYARAIQVSISNVPDPDRTSICHAALYVQNRRLSNFLPAHVSSDIHNMQFFKSRINKWSLISSQTVKVHKFQFLPLWLSSK